MNTFSTYYGSPIGHIEIVGTREYITTVQFADEPKPESGDLPDVVQDCRFQIHEYFSGIRKTFTVDVKLNGTDFQTSVWRQLQNIAFGSVASYKDVAQAVGRPNAFRAVGNANHKNPIAIIVPCHRVIGKNGELIGYGGGLWRKQWLLEHESALP